LKTLGVQDKIKKQQRKREEKGRKRGKKGLPRRGTIVVGGGAVGGKLTLPSNASSEEALVVYQGRKRYLVETREGEGNRMEKKGNEQSKKKVDSPR